MNGRAVGFRTAVTAAEVTFQLPDTAGEMASASVWLDLDHHSEPPRMRRVAGGWELRLARPPVQRLEYLFAVVYDDGAQAMICDPTNQARTPTAFGDHSVIEFPGYREPAWLTTRHTPGSSVSFAIRVPGLSPDVAVTLWSPDGVAASAPLPLLMLHDGPGWRDSLDPHLADLLGRVWRPGRPG